MAKVELSHIGNIGIYIYYKGGLMEAPMCFYFGEWGAKGNQSPLCFYFGGVPNFYFKKKCDETNQSRSFPKKIKK